MDIEQQQEHAEDETERHSNAAVSGSLEGGREVAWDVRADGRGAPSGRERADVLALAPLGWVVALVGQQHDPVVQL